jgi:hypothetical protein
VRRALVAGMALVLIAATGAAAAPTAQLKSEDKLSAAYAQGVARVPGGWIFTGRFIISRTNEKLKELKTNRTPIPSQYLKMGYNHVGDGDVVGKYFYAPFEQGDYTLGHQVTARFDAKTLKFVDAVELPQHENSFVTVDPKTMIAYSLDHFGGQEILRYDVRGNKWTPLAPLQMNVFVDKVQGADVADGFVWLQTSTTTNEMFAVNLKTGEVTDLGSAGHVPGEGEGIDASKVGKTFLHTQVVDPQIVPVYLEHYAVTK